MPKKKFQRMFLNPLKKRFSLFHEKVPIPLKEIFHNFHLFADGKISWNNTSKRDYLIKEILIDDLSLAITGEVRSWRFPSVSWLKKRGAEKRAKKRERNQEGKKISPIDLYLNVKMYPLYNFSTRKSFPGLFPVSKESPFLILHP